MADGDPKPLRLKPNVWPTQPEDVEPPRLPPPIEDVEPLMASVQDRVNPLVGAEDPDPPPPPEPRPTGYQDAFGTLGPPDLGPEIALPATAQPVEAPPPATPAYQDAFGTLGPPDLGLDAAVTQQQVTEALQSLNQIEAELEALIDELDHGAELRQQLHQAQVEGALISDDNLVRIQMAAALQQYLIRLGGLILDLAAVSDGLGGIRDMTSPTASSQSAIETFDKLYELAKDFESGVNTLASAVPDLPDDARMNVFNDPAGGGIDKAISDDPRLAVQTLKSHASDLIAILKEAELKGFEGDFRQTGLTLAARVLKSMAEAQLELRKLRRNLLQQTLAVEQSIFGASQADWMSFADARFDAIDELTDIRTTRFALESAAAQRFPGALILQPPKIGAFDLTDPHAAVTAVLAPRPALTFENIISAPDPILDPAASPTIDGVRSEIAATEAAIDAASRHLELLEGKRGQIRGLETKLADLQAEQTSVAQELGELRDSTWEPFGFQLRGDDALMRARQSAYRGLTTQMNDVEEQQRILEAELAEIPLLQDRLVVLQERRDALDAKIEAIRVDTEAQAITDQLGRIVAGDALIESGRSWLSGRMMLAGIVAAVVVGALFAILLFGVGDQSTGNQLPAAADDGAPAAASPPADDGGAGGDADDDASSASGGSAPAAASTVTVGSPGTMGCGNIDQASYAPLPPIDQSIPGVEVIPDSVTYAAVDDGLRICLAIPEAANHEAVIASGGYFQATLTLAVDASLLIELTVTTQDGVEPSARVVQRAGAVEVEQFPIAGSQILGDALVIFVPATRQGDQILVRFNNKTYGALTFLGLAAGTFNEGDVEPIWAGALAGDIPALEGP